MPIEAQLSKQALLAVPGRRNEVTTLQGGAGATTSAVRIRHGVTASRERNPAAHAGHATLHPVFSLHAT
ncbi:hypothetical protein PG988_007226 [Apiospora saccharicola]